MTSPIAILMPVYNAETFLPESLASILNQRFADFVLLAADDASQDRSWELLQRAAASDSRIRIFKNPKNLGVTGTLNFLLTQAAGFPLIARMDADDVSEPERLQRQYDFLNAHPDVHVLGTSLTMIDEQGHTLGVRTYPSDPAAIRKRLLCNNPIAHPSVMARAEVFRELGGYRELPCGEDYDLWLRATEHNYVLGNLPDALLRYRINAGQIKQRNLKPTLRTTLKLQRRYLFRKGYFSALALAYHCAGNLLLLLPNRLVLKLFMRMTTTPEPGDAQ